MGAEVDQRRPEAALAGITPVEWAQIAVVCGLAVAIYWDVVPAMVDIWMNDPGYSHGILIPPLAFCFAWLHRKEVFGQQAAPAGGGIWLTAAACALYLVGKMGAEFFLMRVSMVFLLAGLIWTFWGHARLRKLAFPLVLLITMVPLPAIVYNRIAAPLQLFASSVSTTALQWMSIPVLQDGNIIHLAHTSLGVAEACSGLRSISSLSVLALVLGYLMTAHLGARVAMFLLAFPTAIGVNMLRIVGTAVVAQDNPSLAEGFYHSFSGWLVFLAGFGGLYVQCAVITRLTNRKPDLVLSQNGAGTLGAGKHGEGAGGDAR